MTFDPEKHGGRFAPEYPPVGNSDHLPMAWLAMGALGADAARRRTFADAYLPRLAPLPADDPHVARRQTLLDEIGRDGIDTVVGRHLPGLVSGWYRNAYHPLIRTAYGVEFSIPGEVAAGLAYLQITGPCPVVEWLAANDAGAAEEAGAANEATDLFRRARTLRRPPPAGARFTRTALAMLDQPGVAELARSIPDNLRETSRAALSVFAATHDFFALHLVTGSHAFRILHDHAGPRADVIMNLGLLAGYLAVGAPDFRDLPCADEPAIERPALLSLCRDDEHDIKLAYSAWAQAGHWDDPIYLTVAARYLSRQASAAAGR